MKHSNLTLILLVAGMGSRLQPYTHHRPKCLVEVGGRSILAWMLDEARGAGVDRLVVSTGYLGEQVREAVLRQWPSSGVRFVDNPDHASTNNIVSLARALAVAAEGDVPGEVLVAEGDVLLEPGSLRRLVGRGTLAVAPFDPATMDGTVVTLDSSGGIHAMHVGGEHPKPANVPLWKTVNVTCLGREDVPGVLRRLAEAVGAGQTDRYYEAVFAEGLAAGELALEAVDLGRGWCEVDTPEDLARARRIFGVKAQRGLGEEEAAAT